MSLSLLPHLCLSAPLPLPLTGSPAPDHPRSSCTHCTPARPAFDRTEHCRCIAAHGGAVIIARYGTHHMRAIGTARAQAAIRKHGVGYWRELVDAKGWHGRRRPSLAVDLADGQVDAALPASSPEGRGVNGSAAVAPAVPDSCTTSETIAAFSEANQRRIYETCPHASEVRTFHGWLAAGRVVTKGQKSIRLVAPEPIDETGKVRSITPASVFDISETQELAARSAAWRAAPPAGSDLGWHSHSTRHEQEPMP